MSLENKKEALIAELSGIRDPQHRFALVIAKGGSRSPLEAVYKTDEFKIAGCLANLWMVPNLHEGNCYYISDSDSSIVRGIAGLLCDFYSGAAPEEILQMDTSFLADVGINQHLTQNRKNGLGRLEETMKDFARAHLPAEANPAS
ncbi:MAG: SufE family protein [Limisphaerales bacterium]